ncbi:MAG: hypothetical protein ACPGJV_14700 [Bacteriovoracaceae bacterium]
MSFKTFAILFLLFSTGCSDEPKWSPTQMWLAGIAVDSSLEQVPIPQHEEHRRIVCENYGPGCVKGTGKRIKLKGVEFIVLMFETTEQAKTEAYRLNQYYSRNWLFDEVEGEPIVIHFLKKVYDAKNPHKEEVPKKD